MKELTIETISKNAKKIHSATAEEIIKRHHSIKKELNDFNNLQNESLKEIHKNSTKK